MADAFSILRSPAMSELRAAAAAGSEASVSIGGRAISYVPANFSGMTNFAEGGFHLGREAFSSAGELTKTVLQELYRLANGAGAGASAASAAAETNAAFRFADRAFKLGSKLGIW